MLEWAALVVRSSSSTAQPAAVHAPRMAKNIRDCDTVLGTHDINGITHVTTHNVT